MSMITIDDQIEEIELISIAKKMVMAATTAPKARGLNCLSYIIATGNHIELLSAKMVEIGTETQQPFFIRDAKTILQCKAIVLIGAHKRPLNLHECGYCGSINCKEQITKNEAPCVHNIADLGIAIGAAVKVASNFCIDNRIMYSVGKAALSIHLFSSEITVAYAIPLSISSKNIFFDRG